MKKFLKAVFVLLVILVLLLGFVRWKIDHETDTARPLSMSTEDADLTAWIDEDFIPQSLPSTGEPQHPFMATTDQSVMHAGGWETDVHPAAAVFTDAPQIQTRRVGGWAARQCATFTFTKDGKILMLCGGLTSFQLQLLEPSDLTRLAKFDLPMRPSTFESFAKKDPEIIFSDTSSAYIYLDHQDCVVMGDAKTRIRRICLTEDEGDWEFKEDWQWDMSSYVPNDCYHWNNRNPSGECDALTTLMPDFNGLIWWVTRNGRIGSIDPGTGDIVATDFDGEEVQNSFAIDETGAYVVTDHAMYRLELVDGMPTQRWRLPYDRGTGRKIGSINQGSGTSPTILGGGKYVTFTDNADDRIAIIVAYTGDVPEDRERQICQVPVFKSGASATDNSMIGYNRSVILENNHGYTNSMQQKDYSVVTGGAVRVDVRDDESGCDIIWESDVKVPSVVPKFSSGNGIAYFYTFDLLDNGDRLWSLVGLDFETGETVVKIATGTGVAYNNNWASIAVAPNGDTYVGTRQGLIQIRE